MTTIPNPPPDGGDNEDGNHEAGRRRGARKPRRQNPHFMTAAEAISELDGLISRNGFYDAMRRNEIPNVNLGRLKAVPRDFVSQLKERALRKLDEPRDRKTGLACQRPSLQNKMDDNEG